MNDAYAPKNRANILQIILVASIALCGLATLLYCYQFFRSDKINNSVIVLPLVLLLFVIFYFFSFRGHTQSISSLTVGSYYAACLYTMTHWGADLPEALLLLTLLIVMSGVLLGRTGALIMTIIVVITLVILGYIQGHELTTLTENWRDEHINLPDAIIYSSTICIVFIITWLFEREVEKSLHRALVSEHALRQERDSLEDIVHIRTQELKQAEFRRLQATQRFAVLGRDAASLFHDLLNPLATQSLNLEHIFMQAQDIHSSEIKNLSMAAKRALVATQRMEKLVQAVRHQLTAQNTEELFNLEQEVKHVIEALGAKAAHNHVTIEYTIDPSLLLFTSSTALCQVISNILSNAIDSYADIERRENRLVQIKAEQRTSDLAISISDQGIGISSEHLPHIFEPLFTTKDITRGTGIGLTSSLETVLDMGGTITVTSKVNFGSMFTISLPLGLIAPVK